MIPSSSARAWLWTGAAFEPCTSLPIEDRGFRYGMAIFESIRVTQGRPLFLEAHLQSLAEACRQREFPLDLAALAAVGPLLRQQPGEVFARVYVTGGDGGPTDAPGDCRVIILLEERTRPTGDGYRLALSHDLYGPLFGGLKTANYWLNIDALQRARRKGFDEALLFNEHAELVSACMATVFVVHGGVLKTPSPACGARQGTVRAWVREQVPVRECSLFLQDLTTATEIFIANSWIGIVPVTSLEGRVLTDHTLARDLQTRYATAITGMK